MATTQQKGLASQIFFFVLGPALCFLLKDLEPLEGMTPQGMRCLAGCVWLLVWWMSELLPMPATSLMSIPIFAFLGVLPAAKVFAAIGTPSCMLLFGATIIIGLLKESNFIERYAYWCLNLPFIKGSVTRFLLVFTMSAGLLSAIAPNIPLAVLFVSIAVTIGRSCRQRHDAFPHRALRRGSRRGRGGHPAGRRSEHRGHRPYRHHTPA